MPIFCNSILKDTKPREPPEGPGLADIIAANLLPANTFSEFFSAGLGREAQSIVFLSIPLKALLYSGEAMRKPSCFLIISFSLIAFSGSPGPSGGSRGLVSLRMLLQNYEEKIWHQPTG